MKRDTWVQIRFYWMMKVIQLCSLDYLRHAHYLFNPDQFNTWIKIGKGIPITGI